MKQQKLLAALMPLAGLFTSASAQAHEGHGLPGLAHWHSTDVWGFVAAGALVAAAMWLKGRK